MDDDQCTASPGMQSAKYDDRKGKYVGVDCDKCSATNDRRSRERMSDINRPLKIIVISSTVFRVPISGYGGLEIIAWELAKGLASRGHAVGLVAPDGSECPGVSIIPTGPERMISEGRAYGGFGAISHEGQVVREAHPGYWQHLLHADVIIDHSWQKYSYMLKQEGRLTAPVLGVLHAPANTMFSSPPPVEKPCITCISKDQAAHYEALFSPSKARVAYNGIDTEFYKPMAGVKRTKRFLFLARFSSIKGADLAIEACKKAGVGLDLVGDTSITNEPEYFEKCKAMCDGEQIRMVGPATRGQCVRWFSQAFCFLHPNQRFREPLGLAPVEAQLCGTPVITFDYGAMRETVKHSYTGRLVNSVKDFNRAVSYTSFADPVFDGVREIDTWRPNCREWASQFSLENMTSSYEKLCYEAIDGGGW